MGYQLLIKLALRWVLIDFCRLYGDQLGSLQTSFVLLLEHVDFELVVFFQKA